ncbi:hypothetical protein F5051DRAFT_428737 [Lentinula edodes]|nr:hypothetical protein F5051DRAFT_428737 [Lentinula edodes]
MMQQLVRDNRNRENETRDTREPRTDKTCPWDGCPAKALKECPDLADWVAKGKVERNERGFIQLKGGRDLPNETKYKRGLVKTRFERYFEENPSAKTWILDVPQPHGSPLAPALAGIEVSQHNAYTLHSFQGPSMLATAAAYTLQGENDPSEAAAVRDLIFKMETRRATKERSGPSSSSTSPTKPITPSASNPQPPTAKPPTDPEPSKPIPPRTSIPTKPPKPIIGKLPENYVPPQERTVGVQPKEDTRNYRYRAPIETDAAVERVIKTGMSSMVSVRQDDLLAIAPEYRKKVKDSITSRRIGVDGGLLEDMALLEPVLMLDLDLANGMYSVPVSQESLANFFTDFGDAKEGDGFYVARESHSIRAPRGFPGHRQN